MVEIKPKCCPYMVHKNAEKLAKILSNHIAWHWIRHIITGCCAGLAVTQHHSFTRAHSTTPTVWTTQTTSMIISSVLCNTGNPSIGAFSSFFFSPLAQFFFFFFRTNVRPFLIMKGMGHLNSPNVGQIISELLHRPVVMPPSTPPVTSHCGPVRRGGDSGYIGG